MVQQLEQIAHQKNWWPWLFQVPQLSQAIHLRQLVREAPQQVSSTHHGNHRPN